jgi:hypothetical protein
MALISSGSVQTAAVIAKQSGGLNRVGIRAARIRPVVRVRRCAACESFSSLVVR